MADPVRKIKVTRNGRATIPKEIRMKPGTEEGTVLLAEATADVGILRPVPDLEALAGSQAKYATLATVKRDLDRTREDRD